MAAKGSTPIKVIEIVPHQIVTNALTGVSVPVVMNTGIGLWVGSGLGWWSASAQSRQTLTVWSLGAIAALLTLFGLLVLV